MTLEELAEDVEVQACAALNGYAIVWNRWKSAPVFDLEDGTSYQLKEGADLEALVRDVRKDITGNPFPEFLEPVPTLEDRVE